MRTRHARQTLEALRERFGDKLFRTVIRQSIVYAESAERAIPILDYRPEQGADYLSLAGEILRRLGKQELLERLDELSAEVVPAGPRASDPRRAPDPPPRTRWSRTERRSAVTEQDAPAALEATIARYNEAWNAHDLDAIMAMHAPDMVFENHTAGERAEGEAVREHIGSIFETWPDIAFATRRLYVRDGLVVQEWTATATHANQMRRGDLVAEPSGKTITWDGLDVIPFEDGLVKRKDVYSDSVSILRQVGLLAARARALQLRHVGAERGEGGAPDLGPVADRARAGPR